MQLETTLMLMGQQGLLSLGTTQKYDKERRWDNNRCPLWSEGPFIKHNFCLSNNPKLNVSHSDRIVGPCIVPASSGQFFFFFNLPELNLSLEILSPSALLTNWGHLNSHYLFASKNTYSTYKISHQVQALKMFWNCLLFSFLKPLYLLLKFTLKKVQ